MIVFVLVFLFLCWTSCASLRFLCRLSSFSSVLSSVQHLGTMLEISVFTFRCSVSDTIGMIVNRMRTA